MVPPQSEILAVTLQVVAALEAAGVPYLIGGSLASAIYGEPRSTRDVDLVAALQPAQTEPFLHALGAGFYADLEAIQEAVRTRRSFNLVHLDTLVKVDIFVAANTRFVRSQLARRAPQLLRQEPPARAFVASPEDTILAKLEWYRAGGQVSDRQWNDVLGVLKVQGEALDMAYLQEWAAELGLTDLLHRALRDADRN